MNHQIPLDASARADDPKQDDARDDKTHQIAPDLAYQRIAIVQRPIFRYAGRG